METLSVSHAFKWNDIAPLEISTTPIISLTLLFGPRNAAFTFHCALATVSQQGVAAASQAATQPVEVGLPVLKMKCISKVTLCVCKWWVLRQLNHKYSDNSSSSISLTQMCRCLARQLLLLAKCVVHNLVIFTAVLCNIIKNSIHRHLPGIEKK